ncbi:MAG: hypothetical protein VYE22_14760 [Myxococcota bacterium]|nr:hypothetical protein [Myxococcota bacterium]
MRIDELPTEWPWAVGESPFHIKGTAYAFHMEFVREDLPGGVEAQGEKLGDPALQRFFAQTFFTTSWYDVWPLIQAGRACGEVVGAGFERFVTTRAQHQVERDLGLVRRVLLRVLSPRALALRVPSLNASYFDFVEVRSQADGQVVSGACHGLPGPVVRWYQIVTETFIAEVLRRNGAVDHRITWDALEPDGEAHGVPVFAPHFRIALV